MTTTKTPPDHFPDATKMIAALEDDVKAIRDALSEFNRRFTSANSVDVGPRVSVPTAEWRDLRTRLLAHIDAQALRLEAAERLAADRLEQMQADRKQALVWRDQAELYEQVRKFSPREFHALWTKNVTSGAMFDDLVRAAIASEAGK